MSNIRIGISGWAYKEWRGVFYPKGLLQKGELAYASRQINSIEINGTFYSLQTPDSFRKWRDATPDDFLFAVKGSKFITHRKKLNDVRGALANFFASGVLLLGEKLGPILWQFAPWYRFDPETVETFLRLLPRTAKEAAALAKENTIRSKERSWTELVDDVELRYAFEPRHESFFVPEFVDLLRKNNAALTFADTAEKFEYREDMTADFVYIRLHGKDEIYESDYTEEELDRWAKRIRSWQRGAQPRDAKLIGRKTPKSGNRRDVYVYFDNSMHGHAAYDAMYLA
ncbi:MAG TPA: DUF72 domain-containing protein, partial [Pyrinomonadaceae bacterium]|nr:DUF72 domain-containing protein [Pyrinomonadaceae bacterium]